MRAASPIASAPDAGGEKANIHAIIGPQEAGGLALSGHVDTVPVDGQAWSADPFTLRRDAGNLYARGACDMKGFVASFLAAVPDFQAKPLQRPLHLFITYDEETDFGGVERLIDDLQVSRAAARAVRGRRALRHEADRRAQRPAQPERATCAAGPAIPVSQVKGVNAIHAAGETIAWVAAEARRLANEGPFVGGLRSAATPPIQIGTVQGGSILNIIPEHCRVQHGMARRPRRRRGRGISTG